MMRLLQKHKKVTVEEFYKLHKEEILNLVASENISHDLLGGLKYELTFLSGKRGYSFPEKHQLPFNRMAKGQEYFQWLQNGMNPEDFDRIRNGILTAFAHIKAKTKDADEQMVNAGLLINEMNTRRKQALPYYVFINLIANYIIREDENPAIINPQIHAEKCDEIEALLDSGQASFFFNLPQLRRLSEMQSMSETQLIEYLQELKAEEIVLSQKLKVYSSMIAARQDTTT